MRAGINEQTGFAMIARFEVVRLLAQQRLGKLAGKGTFADTLRADEEIGMREPMPRNDLAERLDLPMRTENAATRTYRYSLRLCAFA